MKSLPASHPKTRLYAFFAVLFVALVAIAPCFAQNAWATGNGEVGVGRSTVDLFHYEKTIDISETDINIVITPEERQALRDEADASAIRWLVASIIMEEQTGERETTNWWGNLVIEPVYRWEDYESLFAQKYWHEQFDYSGIEIDADWAAFCDKLTGFGTASALAALSEAEQLALLQEAADLGLLHFDAHWGYDANGNWVKLSEEGEASQENLAEWGRILQGKVEEIYNDKFSDLLVERMAGVLDIQASFAIEPLASDGSEDAAYGVDGTTVVRGTLGGTYGLPSIDFGAEGQFYDAVLEEGIEWLAENGTPDFDGYVIHSESDDLPLRDGRDFVDHVLFIAGGYLRASDDSQESYAGIRGVDASYPGWHCLLEVCDKMGGYSWARYGIPGGKYTQTFNLHLNPAVAYLADAPQADLITGATFDESGRLLTVSKPLLPVSFDETFADIIGIDSLAVGTYRFKLVENAPTVGIEGLSAQNVLTEDPTYIDMVVEEEEGHLVKSASIAVGGALNDYYELTNVLAETSVEVVKAWDDASNQDGIRPDADSFSRSLSLQADGNATTAYDATKTVTDNGDNTYTIAWAHLPKYAAGGAEIAYTVAEAEVAGYKADKPEAADGGTITNKHVPATVDLSITKYWDDADDAAGKRPSADAFKALVHLMADGAVSPLDDTKTVVDNGDNTYTVTWPGLPKYAAGNEVAYTAAEDAVDGYTTQQGTVSNGGTIINRVVPVEDDKPSEGRSVSVQVVKFLKDALIHKNEFTFGLYDADGNLVQSIGTSLGTSVGDGSLSSTSTVAFDPLTFTEVGEYRYTVREHREGTVEVVEGDANNLKGLAPGFYKGGVRYDDKVYDVVIKVSEEAGELVAAVTYPDAEDGVHLTNVYNEEFVEIDGNDSHPNDGLHTNKTDEPKQDETGTEVQKQPESSTTTPPQKQATPQATASPKATSVKTGDDASTASALAGSLALIAAAGIVLARRKRGEQ